MGLSLLLGRSVLTFLFFYAANALPAPAPAPQGTYKSDPADVQTTRASEVNPPYASGTLYGAPSLIGYNSANPSITGTAVIPPSDFELAPGQSEDADLGLYLNFDGVDNFQPIRGDKENPTDPGPSTSNFVLTRKLGSPLIVQGDTSTSD